MALIEYYGGGFQCSISEKNYEELTLETLYDCMHEAYQHGKHIQMAGRYSLCLKIADVLERDFSDGILYVFGVALNVDDHIYPENKIKINVNQDIIWATFNDVSILPPIYGIVQ